MTIRNTIRPGRSLRRLLGRAGMLAMLLAALASCINEEMAGCPQSGADAAAEKVTLQLHLTLPASTSGTRAENHTQTDGTEAETYIDVEGRDYRLLVFDADGALLTDDVNVITFSRETASAQSIVYTMVGEIDLRTQPDKELTDFYVMVLANWNGFGRTAAPSFSGAALTGAGSLYKNAADYNFTLPNTASAAWAPSLAGRQFIPMFGLSNKLSVSQERVVDNWIFSETIPMLRAIAKVELVDNTPVGIASVSLSRSNRNGRFIPDLDDADNASWNVPNVQIRKPSLPATLDELADLPFFRETRLIEGAETNVWVAYLPEMQLSSSDTGKVRPHFDVVLTTGAEHEVSFNNYIDGQVSTANTLRYVLRNHIYHYTVSAAAASLELTMEVLPWNMLWDDDEWHFDNPTVSEYLKWKTTEQDEETGEEQPNGYVDKPDQLRLIMKPGTSDYAEATFTLSAPLKANWYASLVPVSGLDDAFIFEAGYDHGVIDGRPATIRIRNYREKVETENNEARLVIMVEYPDKTQKEAFVVDETGGHYTIVQEKTEIM